MSSTMYDKVRRNKPKRKRDPKFVIVVVLAFALIIGFCIWVWNWNHERELFWEFTSELSSATTDYDGTTARLDGESFTPSADALYSVYGKLTASRQLRLTDDAPGGDCIAVYYANGAVLKLWYSDINVRGWTRDTGIYVEFTDPDGECYSYITDRVQYNDIYSVLKNSGV